MRVIDLKGKERIGLSGMHGTGKTTLAKRISGVTGFTYLPEVARELLQFRNLRWDEFTEVSLFEAFEKSIFYQHYWNSANNVRFVSDRTVIDVLPYIRASRLSGLEVLEGEITYFIEDFCKELYDVVLIFDYKDSYANPVEATKLDYKIYTEFEKMLDDSNMYYFHISKTVYKIKKGDVIELDKGTLIV